MVIKRIPSLGFLFILTTTDQCKLKQTKNLKWCKEMHYFKKEKERKKILTEKWKKYISWAIIFVKNSFSGPLSPAVDDRMELIDNIETLA